MIVISKGDDELLKLEGRVGWHFPQLEDRRFAGFYPANSADAIAQLEALRAGGGEFLVIPRTAYWWLDYYREFDRHLRTRHRVVVEDEDCVLFDLGPA